MFFSYKGNKILQRKPGVKCFVNLRVWRHLRWAQNFVKSDQNATKLFKSLFLHNIIKNMS